jgi:hypothetical protein
MTEEDKIWFAGFIDKAIQASENRMMRSIEAYVDKAIQASETRMMRSIEVYVDKAIQASETRMMRSIEAYVDKAIQASETRMMEQMRSIETTLLTEFQKWASPIEMRIKTHTATLRAVDAEIEYLSDRVKNIEDNQRKAS